MSHVRAVRMAQRLMKVALAYAKPTPSNYRYLTDIDAEDMIIVMNGRRCAVFYHPTALFRKLISLGERELIEHISKDSPPGTLRAMANIVSRGNSLGGDSMVVSEVIASPWAIRAYGQKKVPDIILKAPDVFADPETVTWES